MSMTSEPDHDFRALPWITWIFLVCLLPLFLVASGVDLPSAHAPLSPKIAAGLSVSELNAAAHHALRGSFTHTVLEWTAVCAAAFVVILAFVHFRLTREPPLPSIGVALACAGAMAPQDERPQLRIIWDTDTACRSTPSVESRRTLIISMGLWKDRLAAVLLPLIPRVACACPHEASSRRCSPDAPCVCPTDTSAPARVSATMCRPSSEIGVATTEGAYGRRM